jgi:dimethylhistidine N-methyltransferase
MAVTDFCRDVIRGLGNLPRSIPPKHFYDEEGSRLFEVICEQPEYYPTRTEMALLERHAGEIAGLAEPGCFLIEPGSGNSRKVRQLLNALLPDTYIPIDISCEHLQTSADKLADAYQWLNVHPVCTDITDTLELPFIPENKQRLLFYPGSSIGNFEPDDACKFLANLARIAGDGGALLIGVDLQKDAQQLHAAYNDANGVTAAFNLNLLHRINRELDADLDIDAFDHHAFYNTRENRVEMHLVCNNRQTFHVDGHRFELDAGEHIHTENSYKYTLARFRQLAADAGFSTCRVWTDTDMLFSLHYLEVR